MRLTPDTAETARAGPSVRTPVTGTDEANGTGKDDDMNPLFKQEDALFGERGTVQPMGTRRDAIRDPWGGVWVRVADSTDFYRVSAATAATFQQDVRSLVREVFA